MFLCGQPKDTSEQSRYNIKILIKESKKVGDGMNAYMTYKVVTKVCVYKSCDMHAIFSLVIQFPVLLV